MRVATVQGDRIAAVIDRPDPTPADDFVVVKVLTAPMCTEFKGFPGEHVSAGLGHEAAGEVVALDRAGPVAVGDRVVVQPQTRCGLCDLCLSGDYIHCQSRIDAAAVTGCDVPMATMAQYTLRQASLLTPIPADMSIDHASMALCGLGPAFGAIERMAPSAGETLLISGLGPVGLGGVIVATQRGVRVIGIEPHPYRADLARRLGAEAVVDPNDPDAIEQVGELTGGAGPDCALDCTAIPEAMRFCIDAVRRRGRVAFIGWGGKVELVGAKDITVKGLAIHGSWHYIRNDASRLLEIIAAAGEKIDTMITHTFGLERIAEAFEVQLTGNCGKVLLHPWAPAGPEGGTA